MYPKKVTHGNDNDLSTNFMVLYNGYDGTERLCHGIYTHNEQCNHRRIKVFIFWQANQDEA